MSQTKISYSGFYDFPLAFVASHQDLQYLFWRVFDDDLDDYPHEYDVFLLPDLSPEEIEKSWSRLTERATRYLGKINVRMVMFDPTRRASIDTATFKALPK